MTAFIMGFMLAVTPQSAPLVAPADSTLRPRCGVALVDTFELVVVNADRSERVVSTLTRTREPSIEGGAPVCVLSNRYARPGATDQDSSVLDGRSLAPRRYMARVGADLHQFTFAPDSAIGSVQRADSAPKAIAHGAPRPYFLAVVDLETVRGLPLAVGYAARMEIYNPPLGFRTASVRVDGIDTLTVAGRWEVAWRVAYDAGAAPTLLWLRQSDNELLRSRSALANGAVFWRRRPGDRAS